ncbi:hypothetical protein [Pseudotenacibaculum haliotis]|uniref:PepSY domain-containing protein n=1 Tax=Pseudotenacibaculum haliotis TaxID=1862138 RepID=A0ABW5LS49_9FLAO
MKALLRFTFTILFFVTIGTLSSYGQNKFEREYRIKEKDVPAKAVDFISLLKFDSNIKWYAEESSQGKSIEAKTKFKSVKYSIEFDTNGNLQDVEIEISTEDISKDTYSKIQNTFSSDFSKFKIIKIQKQLSGSEKKVLDHLLKETNNVITIKYEIVVKGKSNKGKNLYEYTFTNSGALEKREKIIFKNSDHLEY